MQIKVYPQVRGNLVEKAEFLEPIYLMHRPVGSSFVDYMADFWVEIWMKTKNRSSRLIHYGHWADYLSFAIALEPEQTEVGFLGFTRIEDHQSFAAKIAALNDLNHFLPITLLMMFNGPMREEDSIESPLDSFMELFEQDGCEKLREVFCTFIEDGNTSFFSKAFEIKQAEYDKEIRNWNWTKIKSNAIANVVENEEGESEGREFLGTVFALFPSGKYYTPYARSNVDALDGALDECFRDALEAIAKEHGGYIFNGEGDPCDVFFGIGVEPDEEDDDE